MIDNPPGIQKLMDDKWMLRELKKKKDGGDVKNI